MGQDSATGVVTTRNVSTGEKEIEGDYLTNAQGEDVVAGVRQTKRIAAMKDEMPKLYAQFERICKKLEKHYREVQDVEFTIERGKLWMLQTRDAKRTAKATVRIAVDLAEERLISKAEAVMRVKPEHVDFFLHPQFDPEGKIAAIARGDRIATGLNVSPGAASGALAFDPNTAEAWGKGEMKDVIMVRPETKPDDVHGMLAAKGILTSRGGRTSHAALVARQFGKPAVVGVAAMEVDLENRQFTASGRVFQEGDMVSIDGAKGDVFAETDSMMNGRFTMKGRLTAFLCGVLFALGLGIAGMTQPDKIIGFLDVTGRWDPALLWVMLGAIAVTAPRAIAVFSGGSGRSSSPSSISQGPRVWTPSFSQAAPSSAWAGGLGVSAPGPR
jgi:pyruvate,phosphate dikinase